jgi:hypothetical protein
LTVLVNWLGMLGSTVGRRIRWRGVVYRMLRGGRVAIERRERPAEQPDEDDLQPPAIIPMQSYSRVRTKTG